MVSTISLVLRIKFIFWHTWEQLSFLILRHWNYITYSFTDSLGLPQLLHMTACPWRMYNIGAEQNTSFLHTGALTHHSTPPKNRKGKPQACHVIRTPSAEKFLFHQKQGRSFCTAITEYAFKTFSLLLIPSVRLRTFLLELDFKDVFLIFLL